MLYDALTRWLEYGPDLIWTLAYALWVIGSTLFLLLRRQRPTTTLAWLLAFWTLPLLAIIGYLLFGPQRLEKQSNLRQRARLLASRVELQPAADLPAGFLDQPFAALANVSRSGGDLEPEPRQAQEITLFEDGTTAFPAIEAAIDAASQTLHLEYYIWEPDRIGTRLRDRLATRARHGLRVRVVVDALGAKNCRGDFWTPLIEAGGEVRKFNAPGLLQPHPGKINFRTHRKIVVIDGVLAFTGGINVMDSDLDVDGRAWRDTHLRIAGAPAADLQAIFLEDWLYSLPVDAAGRRPSGPGELAGPGDGPPLPDDIDRWFPPADPATGPWVQIVDSGPDEPSRDIQLLMFTAITSAQRRIWITTPYFVPDEAVLTALESAAARGVDVRILVPESGDSRLVQAAANTYSRDIARRGAQVWHYQPVMNHSKTMVVDDSLALIGTANLDNRSFRLNFEVLAAIYDPSVTRQLAALFEKDLGESRCFDPDEHELSLLQRLAMNAARLLSPLL